MELSIEEKAKRYDEAIKKAEALYKKAEPMSGCNVILETIFPELGESEDEKIRKSLINYFRCIAKNGDTVWTNLDYDKVITWLEKQGEQPKKVSIWKHWNGNGIAGNGEGKLIYLIKQGHTYSLSSCLPFEGYYIELSELDKLLSEKQGEQKPQRIVSAEAKESMYDKPTWSEDDEYQINTILNELDLKIELCKKVGNKVEEYRYDTQYNWLKSIKDRYTWKPSDEQMQALSAINVTGGISYVGQGQELINLFNDLKKLK